MAVPSSSTFSFLKRTVSFDSNILLYFLVMVIACVSAAACIAMYRLRHLWWNVFKYTRLRDDEETLTSVTSSDEEKDEPLFRIASIHAYLEKQLQPPKETFFRSLSAFFHPRPPVPHIILTKPSGTYLPLPASTQSRRHRRRSSSCVFAAVTNPSQISINCTLLKPEEWIPKRTVVISQPVTADTIKNKRKAVVDAKGGRGKGRSRSFYSGMPVSASRPTTTEHREKAVEVKICVSFKEVGKESKPCAIVDINDAKSVGQKRGERRYRSDGKENVLV